MNENVRISIKISLRFVPKTPINNVPVLVQIMAWHRSGNKPLSERMMGYRNWYLDFGHCGVTNDLESSPQPEGEPKSRYQFLFYHDASRHIKSMQIWVWISRKSLIKLLQISHYGKHGNIVKAASLVTSWLPLWCHSDACVTKSWQYASLKK